jgi:metallophosphoesterase (TIGR00282 family)
MKPFRVLAVGDVVGEPGREACKRIIPRLRHEKGIDFVIANVENLAGGSGITEKTTRELFDHGVDVMTNGDHVFRKKDAEELLQKNPRVLRPANFPAGVPGSGSVVAESSAGIKVGVLNLLGRVFLKTVDCPFAAAKKEVESLRRETPVILVDMHAEATSEKVAMGWFLDGLVSGVFGTHTHIQTADECILPRGTAYITELGMCGPYESVIGRKIDEVLHMFLTQMPSKLEVATGDPRLSGALFEIDVRTGKATGVSRVHEKLGMNNA